LVIAQTAEVHEELILLLERLRDARGEVGNCGVVEKPDPAEVVTRVYWLTAEGKDRDEVRATIRSHIDFIVQTAKTGDVRSFAIGLPDRFVVRQRRDVQARLQRLLLEELEVCSLERPQRESPVPEGSPATDEGGMFAPAAGGR
jgi:hypothetical protein